MNGAIFYSGQYGSTAQYAEWISDATGFPAFDVNATRADPAVYDVIVLGSSVIMYKLTIRKWVARQLTNLIDKPVILYTVSGAASGPKLDGWIDGSLPVKIRSTMEHFALGGRMCPPELSWWIRLVLKIGAWTNKDPESREDELNGFDFMDKASISPIVDRVRQIQKDRFSEVLLESAADPVLSL